MSDHWDAATKNDAEPLAELLDEVRQSSRDKQLFIGFDRDGTLVPYADRPENAIMTDELRGALAALAQRPRTIMSVVSARSIPMLQGDFDNERVALAGNYGMEIRMPSGVLEVEPIAKEARGELEHVRDFLSDLARPEINAIVEDHGYSLCLHWHGVPVERREEVNERIRQAQDRFPSLLFVSQPTSFEALPRNQWNKGKALDQIFKLMKLSTDDCFCVFFGDSEADEYGFQWANDQGGTSVKVGAGSKNTVSRYQVADTALVQRFIEQLVATPQK